MFTIEPEVVFRLSVFYFRSPLQLFISMLAQQHSTLQHNKDVVPSIDAREESALCLLFGIPCFVTACYASHHMHVEGRQPACVEELHFIITLQGVHLFVLVLFLGQLIPIF